MKDETGVRLIISGLTPIFFVNGKKQKKTKKGIDKVLVIMYYR